MFTQRVGQGSGAPKKHATVPEVVSRFEETSRALGVWFLSESADAIRFPYRRQVDFDITVSSFSARWTNPQHHDVFAGSGDFNAFLQNLTIAFFVPNHMVRREHSDYRVGIPLKQNKSCQADSRCGI